MKSILQFAFSLVFAGLLYGQSPSDISTDDNRMDQHRSIRDRMSKFKRDQTHNTSRNELNRYTQSSKPMHKITGNGVDTAWVRHYGSGLLPSEDWANDIAVDNLGNVYVTGTIMRNQAGVFGNYFTIKYNSDGDTVWTRRYESATNATSLAVDGSGNVYVTGWSNTGSSIEIVTIKYSPKGETVWISSYPGESLSLYDDYLPVFLDIDDSDYVYVSGASHFHGTPSQDIATIKYNSNGDTVWTRRCRGSSYGFEVVKAMAVDQHANICVIGSHVAVKYNSNGDTLWIRDSINAELSSLATDDSGNVYVAGTMWGQGGYDVVVTKFNPLGDTTWTARNEQRGYGDANSLVVDATGNVYVTGGALAKVIKFNRSGSIAWIRPYQQSNQSYSQSRPVLAIGIQENIILTYAEFDSAAHDNTVIVNYDTAGSIVWRERFNGPKNLNDGPSAFVVDQQGYVYVAGISNALYARISPWNVDYFEGDFCTLKFTSVGQLAWAKAYELLLSDSRATSLALDKNGNVYLTGESRTTHYNEAYTTVKFNTSGDTEWIRRIPGFGNPLISLDEVGSVYVSGSSGRVKYNSSGDTVWIGRFDGLVENYFELSSIAVNAPGNMYATGSSLSTIGYDYVTAKYSAAGTVDWVRKYNGLGSDLAKCIAVDISGNVYVTGSTSSSSIANDYATIKYNPSGDTVWIRQYNGPANLGDVPRSLSIDGNGNVYVTGWSASHPGVPPNYDFATIKYNPFGDTVWVRRYDGSGSGYDDPHSLIVDSNGDVYVTGLSADMEGHYNNVTIKYDANGNTVWTKSFTPSPNSPYLTVLLIIDGVGNLYVTASGTTIKYNNSGIEEWRVESSSFHPVGIGIDSKSNVHVAGTTITDVGYIYTVIKYVQTPTSVNDGTTAIPSEFRLEQNFPNPFNPSTTIRYSLPSSSFVKLTIHDILGREIATLVNEEQNAGWKGVKWNASSFASGMYLARMSAGNFIETKKILLMK